VVWGPEEIRIAREVSDPENRCRATDNSAFVTKEGRWAEGVAEEENQER